MPTWSVCLSGISRFARTRDSSDKHSGGAMRQLPRPADPCPHWGRMAARCPPPYRAAARCARIGDGRTGADHPHPDPDAVVPGLLRTAVRYPAADRGRRPPGGPRRHAEPQPVSRSGRRPLHRRRLPSATPGSPARPCRSPPAAPFKPDPPSRSPSPAPSACTTWLCSRCRAPPRSPPSSPHRSTSTAQRRPLQEVTHRENTARSPLPRAWPRR